MSGGDLAQPDAPQSLPVEPGHFAAIVKRASDEQLAAAMAASRDQILGQIFAAMPRMLIAERAADRSIVADWEIVDADGAMHRFQVRIEAGRCSVIEGGDADSNVRFRLGEIDFLKLVSGNASGPELFVFGRLKIAGSLVLAARYPGLFTIPRPPDIG